MSTRASASRVSKSVRSAANSVTKSLRSVTKSTENIVIAILLVILVVLVVYYVRQNNEGFDSDKPTLYFFYVDWCPHCTRARPEIEKVKRNNNRVIVVMVNCDEEKQLARQHNVRAYPTLKLLPNSNASPNEAIELEQAVTEENVNDFINSNL
tara:strand:- start:469 stop:927 length:459 start_codon:yes stop_codon:yes gene_type:complete